MCYSLVVLLVSSHARSSRLFTAATGVFHAGTCFMPGRVSCRDDRITTTPTQTSEEIYVMILISPSCVVSDSSMIALVIV